MVRPIYLYGQPVLTTKAKAITSSYAQLPELIQDMYDTMYQAKGV